MLMALAASLPLLLTARLRPFTALKVAVRRRRHPLFVLSTVPKQDLNVAFDAAVASDV
jgi:hypothetical protein